MPATILICVTLATGAGLAIRLTGRTYESSPTKGAQDIQVYFAPDGGCTAAIVKQIEAARECVYLQAYAFTSPVIAQALAAAHDRGVEVIVILDRSQATSKYSVATYLTNHGIPVYIDRQHAIAHNKIILIDRKTLITGSFNFTKAAETSNAENLLVIHGLEALIWAYMANFNQHLFHAEAYNGITQSGQ